jgi:hypothetical protein
LIRICQECLGSIHTKKCPKCTQIFETTIINWDKIPSNDNIASVINPQPYDLVDPLWVSLNKYLVIDVEENQKLLLKEKEEKINEKKKIVSSKEAKIREEAKKNVDKILSEMNKSIRELEGKDNEISTEIEKIFQKNQQEIEKESKEIKQKVDNRQIDFNNIDILKRKSDDLKNKLIEKKTEIRNIKINVERNQSIITTMNTNVGNEILIEECKNK